MNADKIILLEHTDEPLEVHCYEMWEQEGIWADGSGIDTIGTMRVLQYVLYKVYSKTVEITEILEEDERDYIENEISEHYPFKTKLI